MSTPTQDPRFRNELFSAETLSGYLKEYAAKLQEGLNQIPEQTFDAVLTVLEKTIQSGARIYVGGNGGSSAIADHLCCDWMKGTHIPKRPGLRVHSLTANIALFTALANDVSYEQSLSKQIEMLGEPGDVVMLISSSGNSPNILAAAETAHAKKMTIIGLSGFTGGKLKTACDYSLYVPVHNYGIVEDAHQTLMHVLAQFLARTRDAIK